MHAIDSFSCPFALRGAFIVKTKWWRMVGIRCSRNAKAPRATTCGDEEEEQLEQVVQVHACIRRRMLAPGHLVVETKGKQCNVREEEEYDDKAWWACLTVIMKERSAVRPQGCLSETLVRLIVAVRRGLLRKGAA